ncbi:tocopherol cyclase family protein [Dolosicoccus paucivorans]|uniref:Tocopherol cyclase n=1 Tax=Dolosicoccus paucivorans TaxID=84521 RepID=A0A1G8JPF6_9LACT|nr:tocopherol cyclase family protein [Dolosicoccus paucivorans]PMB84107.1 hypothetical protein CJ206_05640 [Dolosicoccus paucivorans]PMC58355.1 hypothetical protein CJ205_04710 [Dolosicoccus paucivorans]SDI33065.1 Tocopherol cyclase [Dolosicoccus paucivorans]
MDKWQVQQLKRKHYFEGWYYKLVSADEKTVVAIIPSFAIDKGQITYDLQLFISKRLTDGFEHDVHHLTFSSDQVILSQPKEPMKVQYGKNRFTKESVHLNIQTTDLSLEGSLQLNQLETLNKTRWMPNIMGPFSYLSFMECFHDIGAMDALIEGELQLQGESIDFTNGRAHLEKDWGSSFPKYYIWLQSNHFTTRPRSLFFSWAHIPLGPFWFNGFICHLWTGKEHLRFATYNGTKCHVEVTDPTHVKITLTKGQHQLIIKAHQTGGSVDLKAPKLGLMNQTIKEGLMGSVSFWLYEKETCILEDHSPLAGLEIVSELTPVD